MFPASIAFVSTIILSLSSAIHGVPVARQAGIQACTGASGSGDCIPLKAGVAFEDGICNNISTKKFKSLVFASPDDECLSFPNPDCQVGEGVAHEFFLGNSDTLLDGIESFSCN